MKERLKKPRFWSTKSLNPKKYLKDSEEFYQFLRDNQITQTLAAKILYISVQSLGQAKKRGRFSRLWLNHLQKIKECGLLKQQIADKDERLKALQERFSELNKLLKDINNPQKDQQD